MDTDDSGNDYKPLVAGGSKFQLSVYELKKSPLRAAAVGLGLLCVLLLAGIIGQRVHYNKTERDQQNSYNALSKEKDSVQENLKTAEIQKRELVVIQSRLQDRKNYLTSRTDNLKTTIDGLKREKNELKTSQSQLQSSNNALAKERDQLKITQGQLQTNVDSLSKARDSLQTRLSSMLKDRNESQARYDFKEKEKVDLQNKCNNLSTSNEQLNVKYSNLTKAVELLELDYNSTTSEKDKLHISHTNLTKEREILQASYRVVEAGRNELEGSVTVLSDERDRLKMNYDDGVAKLKWLKDNCDNLTAERETLQRKVEALNATIRDKTCPFDWRKFQNSCYYTSTAKKSWIRSREDCQNKAADLVIINSEEEMTFVNSLNRDDKETWIGLTDEGQEGMWKWVDGSLLDTNITFWGSGQPNSHNGKNQDCVEIWHRSSRQGEWNDEGCDKSQLWICEK